MSLWCLIASFKAVAKHFAVTIRLCVANVRRRFVTGVPSCVVLIQDPYGVVRYLKRKELLYSSILFPKLYVHPCEHF